MTPEIRWISWLVKYGGPYSLHCIALATTTPTFHSVKGSFRAPMGCVDAYRGGRSCPRFASPCIFVASLLDLPYPEGIITHLAGNTQFFIGTTSLSLFLPDVQKLSPFLSSICSAFNIFYHLQREEMDVIFRQPLISVQ